MTRFSIPLLAVLGAQVIIVVGAFTAVILVLSEQQRTEFKDSLYRQLAVRQRYVLASVSNPVVRRIETFEFYVKQYMNGYNNDKSFRSPSDEANTYSLDYALDFYNHFYALPRYDSGVVMVMFGNTSNAFTYPLVNGTAPRNPRKWNMWMADRAKLAVIQNDLADACIGSYPLVAIPASCYTKLMMPYPTGNAWGSMKDYTERPKSLGGAIYISDPTLSNDKIHAVTFRMNFEANFPFSGPNDPTIPASWVTPQSRQNRFVFAQSIGIAHVHPLLLDLSTQTSSRSALFSFNPKSFEDGVEYRLISAKKDFPDFNEEILAATGDSMAAMWKGGATPDPVLNAVFFAAEFMFPNATDSAAFEVSVGGSKYVASAGRIYNSQSDLNWLLIEYTPRADFFGASDRARAVGIIIGVVAAAVVLAVCGLIWLAVQMPLMRLRGDMELASNMQNDKVDTSSTPILTEVAALNSSFLLMNAKLLAARPFLPQSLLRGSTNTTDEEEDEEEDGEAYDEVGDDYSTVNGGEGGKGAARYASPNKRKGGGGGVAIDISDASTIASTHVNTDTQTNATRTSLALRTTTNNRHHNNLLGAASKTGSGRNNNKARGSSAIILAVRREMLFRRVSVLSINVLGFHESVAVAGGGGAVGKLAARSAAHLAQFHTALTRLIEAAVAEERGIVDYFHGDRFVCGFNTARVCGNAARNGAECAAKIWDRFLTASSSSSAAAIGGGTKPITSTNAALRNTAASSATNNGATAGSPIGPIPSFYGGNGLLGRSTSNASSYASTAHSGCGIAGGARAPPNALISAFPLGLAMGLGVGRAAVGNHGTDTMQRLATIGGAYSEAMRLQEAMSRRVLLGTVGTNATANSSNNNNSKSQQLQSSTANNNNNSNATTTTRVCPLIAGRCLVVGRVVSDLEASKVYCQIIGGIDARELLGAAAVRAPRTVEAFAGGKSRGTLRGISMSGAASNPVDDDDKHVEPLGRAGGIVGGGSTPSPQASEAFGSSAVPSGAATPTAFGATNGVGKFSYSAAGLALNTTTQGTTVQKVPPPASSSAMIGTSSSVDHRALVLAAVVASQRSVQRMARGLLRGAPSAAGDKDTNNNNDGGATAVEQLNDGEWLYALADEQRSNPFAAANAALYRLWCDAAAVVGGEEAVAEYGLGGSSSSEAVAVVESNSSNTPLLFTSPHTPQPQGAFRVSVPLSGLAPISAELPNIVSECEATPGPLAESASSPRAIVAAGGFPSETETESDAGTKEDGKVGVPSPHPHSSRHSESAVDALIRRADSSRSGTALFGPTMAAIAGEAAGPSRPMAAPPQPSWYDYVRDGIRSSRSVPEAKIRFSFLS